MKNKYDNSTFEKWSEKINKVEEVREKYIERCEKIIDIYRDNRDGSNASDYKYNILFSNTETILPVVYNDKPKAEVNARDTSIISDRKSAEMIEQTIDYFIRSSDFSEIARLSVLDFLLNGYGVVRPVYKPIIDEVEQEIDISEITPEDKVEEREGLYYRKFDDVVFEEIDFEYVYWKDFLFADANTWEQVPFIAFKSYLTKEEVIEKFDKKKAEILFYEPVKTNREEGASDDNEECEKKALIYEIWDKQNKQQIFFNDNASRTLLEINDDPLKLENFYPIPKPMFSILTSGTCYPIPFFITYQDQARELNEICERINHLIDNMRRRGLYNAEIEELANMTQATDNTFYPVRNWAEFASQGGISGAMQTEDIQSFVNVLMPLVERKNLILEEVYQLVGIADIRRGSTDASETLGAQKLKGKYGTIRISTYQRKVAEYFAGIIKICGEIVINQFDYESIAMITNMPVESEMGEVGEVKRLGVRDLLDDLRRKYPSSVIVDIDSNSTRLDDIDDKAELVELTNALTMLVDRAEIMAGVLGFDTTAKLFSMVVEKFKLGKDIQQEIQDHINEQRQAMEEAKKNPQPQPPTKEEMEMQKAQMQAQMEMQKAQLQAQIEMAKLQVKQQENLIKAEELQIYSQIEKEKVDIKAIEGVIRMEGLKVEAINPNKNIVAGS